MAILIARLNSIGRGQEAELMVVANLCGQPRIVAVVSGWWP